MRYHVVNTTDDASSQPDLVLRLLAEVVRGRDEEAMAMTTMVATAARRKKREHLVDFDKMGGVFA